MSEERRRREKHKAGRGMEKVGGERGTRGARTPLVYSNEGRFIGMQSQEPWLGTAPDYCHVAASLLLLHLAVNVIKRLFIRATTEAAARLSTPEPHLPSFPSFSRACSLCLCSPPTYSPQYTTHSFVRLLMRLANRGVEWHANLDPLPNSFTTIQVKN